MFGEDVPLFDVQTVRQVFSAPEPERAQQVSAVRRFRLGWRCPTLALVLMLTALSLGAVALSIVAITRNEHDNVRPAQSSSGCSTADTAVTHLSTGSDPEPSTRPPAVMIPSTHLPTTSITPFPRRRPVTTTLRRPSSTAFTVTASPRVPASDVMPALPEGARLVSTSSFYCGHGVCSSPHLSMCIVTPSLPTGATKVFVEPVSARDAARDDLRYACGPRRIYRLSSY